MSPLRINILLLFVFLLSSFLCSCQAEFKSVGSESPKTQVVTKPKLSIDFGAIDMRRFRIKSDSSASYYAQKRDRLKNFSEGDELFIQGDGPENSRLFSHVFMGKYTVATKNDSTFQFRGKLFAPTTGNWDDGYGEYESFRFNLKINNTGWSITDLILPPLNLKPELTNIDSLRQQLDNNLDCASKDWDKAVDCFPVLERYEFALFASITSGDSTYLDDYLRLQQNFNIAYAGEFAEYYGGNVYYLLLAQIITPQDLADRDALREYGLIRRVYRFWK